MPVPALTVLFVCFPPLFIIVYTVILIRNCEIRSRFIREFPTLTLSVTSVAKADLPRALENRVAELEALGFTEIMRTAFEFPSGFKGFLRPAYVMLDAHRTTQAAISDIGLMGTVTQPGFQTGFDDGFTVLSLYKVSPLTFVYRSNVGPGLLTRSSAPAGVVYAQHRERIAAASQTGGRTPIVVHNNDYLIKNFRAHADRYGAASFARQLRLTMIANLCLFSLVALLFLVSFASSFWDPELDFLSKSLIVILIGLFWLPVSYLVIKLWTMRSVLFGLNKPGAA